ncbi:MAG: hypothetical protein SGI96_07820 [Bacteroidota bacterium]|nr:hypothetical protein [Bacteroidota bacterium]
MISIYFWNIALSIEKRAKSGGWHLYTRRWQSIGSITKCEQYFTGCGKSK